MDTLPAAELEKGDVLLTSAGENVWAPAFTWSSGEPHKIEKVELIARVTFDDFSVAEFPADHHLDVERQS